MTKNFGVGQGPWTPSRLKLLDYQLSAVETAQPTDRTKGVPVQKQRRIVFSVHPISPDINDAGAVGWRMRFKLWRYKELAREGTGRPAGQWYAEQVFTVSMDGDVATGGPMEFEFPTWDSEKMYFQPVESAGPDTWSAMVTAYELVPRVTEDGKSCECESGASSSSGGGGALVVENMFDLIAHQDYTYSNLRGDFDAVRASAVTIALSKVPFPVEERQILAIGLKRTGSTSRTRMWYRDKDLFVDYNQLTGVITVGGFVINALDAVDVYLEGPSKVDDPLNQARRVRTINPDSKLVTEDSNIYQVMAEAAAVEYVPLNMLEDGLHWLSVHHNCSGDVYVTIEGTSDIDRDGQERWDDITQQLTGYTQITATTPDVIPNQSWCQYRRVRFVLNPGATGGTVDLFVSRSAYGAPWNPQAYDGVLVQPAGPQIMGEAVAVQPAAETAGRAARFITDLHHGIIGAPYVYATQADRTEEDDPIDTRDVGEILADDLDLPQATTHDYYLNGAHYAGGSFQFIPDPDGLAPDGNTQLRIYAALREDGTAPNALEYTEKTLAWFGAAPITTEQLLRFPTDCFLYYWHFEVLRGAGVGTEDYTLITRRAY